MDKKVKDKKLVYCDFHNIEKDKVYGMLSSDDIEKITLALVNISFYEKDFDLAAKIIFKHAANNNNIIRGTAILCIGYLAMNYKNKLPIQPTVELVQRGLEDTDPWVKGRAFHAAEEIEHSAPQIKKFLKVNLRDRYHDLENESDD